MTLSYKYKCSCSHPHVTTFSSSPGASLHVPYLTEQRREFMVVHSPGSEHLGVVVAERSQLRQTAQEASKVLLLLWVLQDTQLPQHVQHGLLKPLDRLRILDIRPI